MGTTCKACNLSGHGMIHIYAHPNNIDVIFTSLIGIQISDNDCLCIPCYDDMKIAYSFRQNCLHSDLLRRTETQTKLEPIDQLSNPPDDKPAIQQVVDASIAQIEMNVEENEISTTSVSRRIELNTESIEPFYSSVESTTSYTENIEDELNNYGENEGSAQMSDYQEFDKDYDDVGLSEKSDDTSQIFAGFIWKCGECNKSFARKGNFQKHIKIHFKTISSTAKTKSRIYKKRVQTLKYDEDIFQDIHETECEFCFTEFRSAKERKIHEVVHRNEEKPYKCPYNGCTSQFKEKYGLRNHIRIHSDYKRYKCRYCDQRFHYKGSIISHERLHTGENPFLCPHCGKAFARISNLKAHIRFHTGERPFTCSICEKSFKTRYAHKIHIRTHTKERPYLFSECCKS